jgi:hypothetical protein
MNPNNQEITAPRAYLVESIPKGLEDLRGTPGVQYTEEVLVRLTRAARSTIDLTAMYWALLPDPEGDDEKGFTGEEFEKMGAGTLGVPRRHWDVSFSGNPFAFEFPGTAWLMIALFAIGGLLAVVGGGMYLLVTVYSVFLGKKIQTPGFQVVPARAGVAAPAPAATPLAGYGSAAHPLSASGTFTLAMVFLVSFVLYYFINWKYLSTVWPLK